MISRRAWVALGFAVGIVAGSCSTPALALDPRGRGCPFPASVKVVGQFEMTPASDYHRHLPAAPDLPELNDEQRAAFVVLVVGPYIDKSFRSGGGNGEVRTVNSAVCVLVDGVPNVYPELNTLGWQP